MTYKTINDTITAEIIIKKSRFICILMPVNQMQDIDTVRDEVRQKYPGANHYCFAYRLRQDGSILERCSDDGEPGGTAGWPMLNVLAQNDLENIIAIVIRYFGGTLLGTGGLVKAYTQSVQLALNKVRIISMEYSQKIMLTLDYNYYGILENHLSNIINEVADIQYAEQVRLEMWVAFDKLDTFIAKVENLSSGTANIEMGEQNFIPNNLRLKHF
ncbi:MAG: YigZ family protein [Syntrophomonadaceae bacterium]|nr:YigZ family protein [Syntrophomonadaceae bacterium]